MTIYHWTDEPLKPFKRTLRTVAVIKGLSKDEVLRVLKKAGEALPLESCRIEETPHGVLLGTEANLIGSVLARRYPRATVYSVTAMPNLEKFFVLVKRGRGIEQFDYPPVDSSYFPVSWVVLAPGDAAWLEKRTREILEEEAMEASIISCAAARRSRPPTGRA